MFRHRTYRRWCTATIAMLALVVAALAAPAGAHAAGTPICTVSGQASECHADGRVLLAGPNEVGWVYLTLNYCAPGRACTREYMMSTLAYRWSSNRWVQASIGEGWVYVYPFSGNWRWVYTSSTGWLAIHIAPDGRQQLELRAYR